MIGLLVRWEHSAHSCVVLFIPGKNKSLSTESRAKGNIHVAEKTKRRFSSLSAYEICFWSSMQHLAGENLAKSIHCETSSVSFDPEVLTNRQRKVKLCHSLRCSTYSWTLCECKAVQQCRSENSSSLFPPSRQYAGRKWLSWRKLLLNDRKMHLEVCKHTLMLLWQIF